MNVEMEIVLTAKSLPRSAKPRRSRTREVVAESITVGLLYLYMTALFTD